MKVSISATQKTVWDEVVPRFCEVPPLFIGLCVGILAVSFLSFAAPARAATLSFDPQDHTVGMATPFEVGLRLDAGASVNTVSITLVFPPNLTPVDVSDGNSIINFWVDKPTYSEANRTLTFSGIIPGGYTGTGGRLILLKLKASAPGSATLTADAGRSVIYLNTPDAVADTFIVRPFTLSVETGKENMPNQIPDNAPPEAFLPSLVRIPDELGKEQIAVVFATQDKGSGISQYEVRETPSDAWFADDQGWQVAQSPYVLRDQDLRSVIEVRATDKEGNARIETIATPYPIPWYATGTFDALLTLAVMLLAFAFVILKRRKRKLSKSIKQ